MRERTEGASLSIYIPISLYARHAPKKGVVNHQRFVRGCLLTLRRIDNGRESVSSECDVRVAGSHRLSTRRLHTDHRDTHVSLCGKKMILRHVTHHHAHLTSKPQQRMRANEQRLKCNADQLLVTWLRFVRDVRPMRRRARFTVRAAAREAERFKCVISVAIYKLRSVPILFA